MRQREGAKERETEGEGGHILGLGIHSYRTGETCRPCRQVTAEPPPPDWYSRGFWVSYTETGKDDYYILVYDGHECGDRNPIAEWIARRMPIEPTGNFVFAHKKWVDGTEINVRMDKTLQELKTLFKNGGAPTATTIVIPSDDPNVPPSTITIT